MKTKQSRLRKLKDDNKKEETTNLELEHNQQDQNNENKDNIQQQNGLIKEGWLKIHADSLLDEKIYPEMLQPKTEFQRKQKKLKIEIDEENNNLRKNEGNKDAHYFRLTKQNLWYTQTQADPVVLGSVSIKNIVKIEKGDDPECIKIEDNEEDQWILCEPTKEEKEDAGAKNLETKEESEEEMIKEIAKWECELLKLIGEECDEESMKNGSQKQVEIQIKREIIKQPLIIIPLPSLDCEKDWGYSQNGADWQCKCNEGYNQSPIDIPPNVKNFVEPIEVSAQFSYNLVKKEEVHLIFETNLLRIKPIDREKTVLGSIEDTQGNLYNAYEIQIHTPADHQINQEKFKLEMQIYHEAVAGDFKRKAVLSLLFKLKAGIKNGFWDTIDIMDLPTADNPIPANNLIKQDFSIYQFMFETLEEADKNLNLPFNYFYYEGSSTTPGCEEYVSWYIVDTPLFINNVVLQFMQDSTYITEQCTTHKYLPSFFTGTNRKIQPTHNRTVYYYTQKDYCAPNFNTVNADKNKEDNTGHYEKVEKNCTKYYFVKGMEPSGMPGALVVSGDEEEEIKKQHKNM